MFLADSPLDVNEGATGAEVLEVTLPDDVDLPEYELVEDHEPYREWCVPAAVINRRTANSTTPLSKNWTTY